MWELSLSPKNSFQIHKFVFVFFTCAGLVRRLATPFLRRWISAGSTGVGAQSPEWCRAPEPTKIGDQSAGEATKGLKKPTTFVFVRVHTEINNNNNERNCVVIVRQSVDETTEFCFSLLFRVYETCRLNGSPWHTEPWAGRKSESGYIRRRRWWWWWERSGGYPVGGGGCGREEGRDTHTHLADWPTLTVSVCSRRSCCAENNNMWSSGVPPLHGVV